MMYLLQDSDEPELVFLRSAHSREAALKLVGFKSEKSRVWVLPHFDETEIDKITKDLELC